jgi:hypothetical protein
MSIRRDGCELPALVCILLLPIALAAPALAAKTDVVTLSNGDEVTGEVKELYRGLLRYSTDHMGTVYIEWEEIVALRSSSSFQLETSDGDRHFGYLADTSGPGALVVVGVGGEQEIPLEVVVRIEPIKATFWGRLDGSIRFGGSYTKSSDVLRLTFGGSVSHRTRKRKTAIDVNTIITEQTDADPSRNQDAQFAVTRFLRGKNFVESALLFEQNTELGLDLRTSVRGVYGRHMVQTNRSLFDLAGGLSVNQEQSADDTTTNWEAIATVRYEMFRFNTPKTDLFTILSVFPSLTQKDRVRSNFDIRLRQELVKDLFWDLSFYWAYDSQPATEGASEDDYGLETAVSWTF